MFPDAFAGPGVVEGNTGLAFGNPDGFGVRRFVQTEHAFAVAREERLHEGHPVRLQATGAGAFDRLNRLEIDRGIEATLNDHELHVGPSLPPGPSRSTSRSPNRFIRNNLMPHGDPAMDGVRGPGTRARGCRLRRFHRHFPAFSTVLPTVSHTVAAFPSSRDGSDPSDEVTATKGNPMRPETMTLDPSPTAAGGMRREGWPGYTYEAALAASERVNWRVEDVIGGDKRLDFSKPFLPESLARVQGLAFLSPAEKRILNQIRGHDYLYIFGLVEEFIVPYVLDHVRPMLHADDTRVRAFLQFAAEEAKHIQLFRRFRQEFLREFGSECEVIGPPEAIAQAVLSKHPLSVALAILQIEWMTQRHYVDSIRDDGELDPQFKSLLKHHWMEEAQHAKLDTLMVEAIGAACSPEEVATAIDGYLEIGGMLDGGLIQQVEFDVAAFERAARRTLGEAEREEFRSVQRQATRWTFLGSGMTHKSFLATLELLSPGASSRILTVAPAFC